MKNLFCFTLFALFFILVFPVTTYASEKTMSSFEIVGANKSWVVLREVYSVSECCGGKASLCQYPGLGTGEGVNLHFVPKAAVDASNGKINFSQAKVFEIYKSTLDKLLCTKEEIAVNNLKKAKDFAKSMALDMSTANKKITHLQKGSGKKLNLSWSQKIKEGWHDKECQDMGCDRFISIDFELKKKNKKIFEVSIKEVFKGNGYQGANNAILFSDSVLLLRPFDAFLELKREQPLLFFRVII
tara:strand:+ start:160499 stop:161227 length:729 start_codon:yes stop_codon:yes gene_type:complete